MTVKASRKSPKARAKRVVVKKVEQVTPDVQKVELELHGAPPAPQEPLPEDPVFDADASPAAPPASSGWRKWLKSWW